MIAIYTCVDINMVTSNSLPSEKYDMETMIHELIKSSVKEEMSVLTKELQEAKSQLAEAKSQLAEARLYLGQTIIAVR